MQDYGNIILIDSRFDSDQQKGQITGWLRDSVVVYDKAEQAIKDYKDFFIKMKSRNFIPKVQ